MKNFLKAGLYLSLAAILTVQCTKNEITGEPEIPAPGGKVTLTVRSEAPFSKTSLEEDGRVLWSEGDMIIVNGEPYEVVPDAEDPSFATIPDVTESSSYLAVYSKYSNSGELSGEYMLIHLPQEQMYVMGTFGQYSNPMVAYSETTELNFRNLAGIVKVGIKGDGTLGSVAFRSNDNCMLAGTLKVPLADVQAGTLGNYSGFMEDYMRYASVKFVFPDGLPLDPSVPTYFYFVVPAKEYAEGFSVVMEGTDGTVAVQSTEKSVTVNRSEIVTMEDFDYSPIVAPSLETEGVTAKSVLYRITAAPNSQLMVAVINRTAYDSFISESGFTDASLMAAMTGESVQTDASGSYSGTASRAVNATGGLSDIQPATEYVIMASYSDGTSPVGEVVKATAVTGQPEGEAPGLDVTPNPSDRPYAQVSFTYRTTGAESVSCYMFERILYESLISGGKTDSDLIAEYATSLAEPEVAAANTAEGVEWFFLVTPATEYTLLVSAAGPGGMAVIEKYDFTTDEYLLEDDPEWRTISTTGYMQCGLFSVFLQSEGGPVGQIDFHDLVIQRLGDKDVFRIVNPFADTEYGFGKAEGDSYIVLDARDNGAVLLEGWPARWENHIGLIYPGSESFGDIYVVSSSLRFGTGSLGTYDPETGFIDFGTTALLDGMYMYASETAPTYLYISTGEHQPESGASTESFTFAPPIAW